MSEKDMKLIVKAGREKAADNFSEYLSPKGFTRTKKWLWTRKKGESFDWIGMSFVGSGYGAINHSVWVRLECGNRELNDSRDFMHLNGPKSDSTNLREKRYHHRFNAKSGSTYDRCIVDLKRFYEEIAEPWYKELQNPSASIKETPEIIKQSYKLLGIKGVKL